MTIQQEVMDYYSSDFDENARLRKDGYGRLELLRTQDILRRSLPSAPGTILDVGGASGVYAEWLAAEGYDVTLIDPVPEHVATAGGLRGVRAAVGDARDLEAEDSSYDNVLMMGPLYHLQEKADRLRALAEAARVVKPGGVVVVAAICRFAALLDGFRGGFITDEISREVVERGLEDGCHLPPRGRLFTSAYFHRPDEFKAEVGQTPGLTLDRVLGVEGPLRLIGDLDGWLDDPERLPLLMWAARQMEDDESTLGAGSHLLAIARRSK